MDFFHGGYYEINEKDLSSEFFHFTKEEEFFDSFHVLSDAASVEKTLPKDVPLFVLQSMEKYYGYDFEVLARKGRCNACGRYDSVTNTLGAYECRSHYARLETDDVRIRGRWACCGGNPTRKGCRISEHFFNYGFPTDNVSDCYRTKSPSMSLSLGLSVSTMWRKNDYLLRRFDDVGKSRIEVEMKCSFDSPLADRSTERSPFLLPLDLKEAKYTDLGETLEEKLKDFCEENLFRSKDVTILLDVRNSVMEIPLFLPSDGGKVVF